MPAVEGPPLYRSHPPPPGTVLPFGIAYFRTTGPGGDAAYLCVRRAYSRDEQILYAGQGDGYSLDFLPLSHGRVLLLIVQTRGSACVYTIDVSTGKRRLVAGETAHPALPLRTGMDEFSLVERPGKTWQIVWYRVQAGCAIKVKSEAFPADALKYLPLDNGCCVFRPSDTLVWRAYIDRATGRPLMEEMTELVSSLDPWTGIASQARRYVQPDDRFQPRMSFERYVAQIAAASCGQIEYPYLSRIPGTESPKHFGRREMLAPSPDGRLLAYVRPEDVSDPEAPCEIGALALKPSVHLLWRRDVKGAFLPHWSDDGRYLAYTGEGGSSVEVLDVNTWRRYRATDLTDRQAKALEPDMMQNAACDGFVLE